MAFDLNRLVPFRRQQRPAAPESFPFHVDREFVNIEQALRELRAAAIDHETRLRALETPP